MTEVIIKPMPESYRKIPSRLLPMAPSPFADLPPEGPSAEDWELAKELFKILDPESQRWYARLFPQLDQ
jgi:hypothetical protein